MVNQISQYRSAVSKGLACTAAAKRRLLKKLDSLLEAYAEEHESPSDADLAAAFGTPEEMASGLMRDITPKEQELYRKQRNATRIILSILLAAFVAFTVWLYFFKEVGITSYTEGYIIDVSTSPLTTETRGVD